MTRGDGARTSESLRRTSQPEETRPRVGFGADCPGEQRRDVDLGLSQPSSCRLIAGGLELGLLRDRGTVKLAVQQAGET